MATKSNQNPAFDEDQVDVATNDPVDDGWVDRRYSGNLIDDCDAVRAMEREAACAL